MKSEFIVAILRWVVHKTFLPNMKGTWIHSDILDASFNHHYIIPLYQKFNRDDIKKAYGEKV